MANRDSRLKELERLVGAEGSGERRFLMQIVMERFSKEELREATDAYLAAHPDIEWPNGILVLDIVRGEDGRAVAFGRQRLAPS